MFTINQGFDLNSPLFNFKRDYFDDIASLKAADENSFPNYFITNVAGALYLIDKSNSEDASTGKWRKVKTGDDVNLSNYAKLNGKNYFIETCEFANSVNFNSSVRFNNIVKGFTVEKKVDSYITAYNLKDRIMTKVFATDGSLFDTTTLAKKSDIKGYVLPTATTTALGGIKTNYTLNDKNYPVKVDDSGNAYVNVPWEVGTADLGNYLDLTSTNNIIRNNETGNDTFTVKSDKDTNLINYHYKKEGQNSNFEIGDSSNVWLKLIGETINFDTSSFNVINNSNGINFNTSDAVSITSDLALNVKSNDGIYINSSKKYITAGNNESSSKLFAADGSLFDTTTLAKTTDLSNYIPTQGGKITTNYIRRYKQYELVVSGDPDVDGSSGRINISKFVDGDANTDILLDGANGSITATTGMFDGKVQAEGFLAKNNGSANEVWTTNGSKLNLLDIIKKTLSYTAIYVNGEILAGPISSNNPGVDDVNDAEKIIFDSSNGRFVALQEGTYYSTWNSNMENNIESAARYGESANTGIYPYIDLVYRFSNGNLYLAKVVNNKYTLEEIKLS